MAIVAQALRIALGFVSLILEERNMRKFALSCLVSFFMYSAFGAAAVQPPMQLSCIHPDAQTCVAPGQYIALEINLQNIVQPGSDTLTVDLFSGVPGSEKALGHILAGGTVANGQNTYWIQLPNTVTLGSCYMLYYVNYQSDAGNWVQGASTPIFQIVGPPQIANIDPAPVAPGTSTTISGGNFARFNQIVVSEPDTGLPDFSPAMAVVSHVEGQEGGQYLRFDFPIYLYRWDEFGEITQVNFTENASYKISVVREDTWQEAVSFVSVKYREAIIFPAITPGQVLHPQDSFLAMTYGSGLDYGMVQLHKVQKGGPIWSCNIVWLYMPNGLAQISVVLPEDTDPGAYQLSYGDDNISGWSNVFIVEALPVPPPLLRILASADDPVIPEGGSTMFRVMVAGGDPMLGYSVSWTGDLGAVKDSGKGDGVYAGVTPGAGLKIITCTVTSGCQTATGTVKVFVPAPPVVSPPQIVTVTVEKPVYITQTIEVPVYITVPPSAPTTPAMKLGVTPELKDDIVIDPDYALGSKSQDVIRKAFLRELKRAQVLRSKSREHLQF